MNFIHPPLLGTLLNQEFIGPAFKGAIKFKEGLISLAVQRKANAQDDVQNNLSLFLIQKPSQLDEFRSIVDGKVGGNEIYMANPCHMISPGKMISFIYTYGWSANLDIAKYFHIFLNLPAEHKYLRVTYLGNKEMYAYDRFLMGTHNSLVMSGRIGLYFIWLTLNSSPIFT